MRKFFSGYIADAGCCNGFSCGGGGVGCDGGCGDFKHNDEHYVRRWRCLAHSPRRGSTCRAEGGFSREQHRGGELAALAVRKRASYAEGVSGCIGSAKRAGLRDRGGRRDGSWGADIYIRNRHVHSDDDNDCNDGNGNEC